ncbi:MAG: ABC transporter permease [Acidobacteriaceae bacterium]|nr:ABC transporter permease [Acidobacteriaceae bacterium]
MRRVFDFAGTATLFGLRVTTAAFLRPYEWNQIWTLIGNLGTRSLSLVASCGLALGVVMTLHTRGTLTMFGATGLIPKVQSLGFFVEIGPLLAALLVAGRVGAGIGAVLADMRATEQIDAIEALSIDSFKFLVVPRVVACVLVLPLLTTFMDCCGIVGGYVSSYALSRISWHLYVARAFTNMAWSNFVPPTLKTAVFGFIIGTVSCFFGYTTNEGADGVGRAATNSVVVSSLLIVLADVILVKLILLFFPGSAL